MIWIKPSKYRLEFKDKHIDKTFKLKDGSRAIYSTKIAEGFNLLAFEKDNWQYILNIDKGVSDKITAKTLVEIADSIN